MTKVLVTNGGTHSPEKWAMATAEMICDPTQLKGDKEIAAKKLQLAIAEGLMKHHEAVQKNERDLLAANGTAQLGADMDVSAHTDAAFVDVQALAKGTPWEAHYAKPEVVAALRATLTKHFKTHVKTERSWHADKNPNDPHAKRFHAALRGETISAEG